MSAVTFLPFRSRDKDALNRLLEAENLPTADLTAAVLENFLVAHADDAVVGAAGLEQHGNVALLRSVVVAPLLRGTGLGKRLVQEIEKRADKFGVTYLYLLTTTADSFFTAQGYVPVPREEAPVAIRKTAEFSHLCPASSVFMKKNLE
ncbi:MAG TPA: arsenic resistance N-acetyltransferase ArsN2 [Gammaproteobacteria bacterium]